MSPDTRRKAAFVTHVGLFQFRVMPFSLCSAPATFERLSEVLKHLSIFGIQLKAKKI